MKRILAVFALSLVVAGCNSGGTGGGPPVDAASVLRKLSPGSNEKIFIAGGAPGDLALRCGLGLNRLDVRGEAVRPVALPAYEYLAVYFGRAGTVDRFIAPSTKGPVLVEQDKAYVLPGWPAGVEAGVAAFSPDGARLAVAPAGPNPPMAVMVWRLPLASMLTIPAVNGGVVQRLRWSLDGKSLLFYDDKDLLSVYRPPDRRASYTQQFDPAADGMITAADISPDGDWFVVAANAIRVLSWRLPFMKAQLKAWGRVEDVFFAGDVSAVITLDETDSAIRWLVNYGNVKADTSRALGNLVAVGPSSGGSYFFGLDPHGLIHGWRSLDLRPLDEPQEALCEVAPTDTVRAPAARTGLKP